MVSYYLSRQKVLEWNIKRLEKKFGFSDEARQHHSQEFESIKRQFERMKKESKEAKRYRYIKKEYEKNLPNKHLWEINKNEIAQERKSIQERISTYMEEREYVTNKMNALNTQKEALHIDIEDFIKEQIFHTLKKE
jgi:alpha-galactosidase/6-phospho-beta-glucosidase family protein